MLELKDICYSPMDEDKILIPEDEITKKEIIKRITEEIKKSVSMTEEDFKIRLIKNNKNFSELSQVNV